MTPELAGAPASTVRMLAWGLTRRCPRCGAGGLFHRWFRMADRCPRCGYVFAREEGFFLGAFVINFAVTIAGLAVIMGLLIASLAGGSGGAGFSGGVGGGGGGGPPPGPGAIQAIAIAGIVEAVVVPIVFYPFSKTMWAGIDLAMHRGERWAAAGAGTGAGPGGS